MTIRFLKEVEKVKKQILQIGARVEESLRLAVRSVESIDGNLARQVIDSDEEIDQMEVELEEEVLKVLALHQPVAVDLRFLIAVLKMNNDLERIGDLAVNIAQWTTFNGSQPSSIVPTEISKMAEVVQRMLKSCLDCLVQMNAERALEVCRTDDEVDDLHRQMYVRIQDAISKSPDNVDPLIHLLGVSRNLERIGDLTTNIAEDVIYTIKGEIIRHGLGEQLQDDEEPC